MVQSIYRNFIIPDYIIVKILANKKAVENINKYDYFAESREGGSASQNKMYSMTGMKKKKNNKHTHIC